MSIFDEKNDDLVLFIILKKRKERIIFYNLYRRAQHGR